VCVWCVSASGSRFQAGGQTRSAVSRPHTRNATHARTCEVHPAALDGARAGHLYEQSARLVVRLAHVTLGQVVTQGGVVQAQLCVCVWVGG
jgi:hypothetical protein